MLKLKRRDQYFVYIVRCVTGTFYTGYTHDLDNRLKLHNSGNGAKYLRGKLPVVLVYTKKYVYYKNALNEERRIKTLSRQAKEDLVDTYSINRKKAGTRSRQRHQRSHGQKNE